MFTEKQIVTCLNMYWTLPLVPWSNVPYSLCIKILVCCYWCICSLFDQSYIDAFLATLFQRKTVELLSRHSCQHRYLFTFLFTYLFACLFIYLFTFFWSRKHQTLQKLKNCSLLIEEPVSKRQVTENNFFRVTFLFLGWIFVKDNTANTILPSIEKSEACCLRTALVKILITKKFN